MDNMRFYLARNARMINELPIEPFARQRATGTPSAPPTRAGDTARGLARSRVIGCALHPSRR
jgi:hypothetical protein